MTDDQTVEFTGSCLCGSVTYEVTESTSMFQHCHCSRCQKVTGSAFASNIFVKPEHFRWLSGEAHVGRYELPEAKYFATAFCKQCGSALPWRTKPGTIVVLPAGSIDTKNIPKRPTAHIHYASRADWYLEDGLPTYEELPSRPNKK